MGFFDLQVNGYAGVDLNAPGLTPGNLEEMCRKLEMDGVDEILGTLITDSVSVMEARIKQLVRCRQESRIAQKMIRGIHLEGPFISPVDGYRGAHPLDAVIRADLDVARRLIDAGDGLVRIMTLAPESDQSMAVTRMLITNHVIVACGHSDADMETLRKAVDAGLTMFTHLGNGCPSVMQRHDNIIQRALSLDQNLWFCFIADGKHIPFFALKNYVRLAGIDQVVLVTDAMAAAAAGPGNFTLGRWNIEVADGGDARASDSSHFVGSTTTMRTGVNNLIHELGLSPEDAHRMSSTNPRTVLGGVGRIQMASHLLQTKPEHNK